jgi:hypothetical protein
VTAPAARLAAIAATGNTKLVLAFAQSAVDTGREQQKFIGELVAANTELRTQLDTAERQNAVLDARCSRLTSELAEARRLLALTEEMAAFYSKQGAS